MSFLVHYLVKTPVKDRHFDMVWDGPATVKDLADIRGICASDSANKTSRPVSDDDIVIANIIPIGKGSDA